MRLKQTLSSPYLALTSEMRLVRKVTFLSSFSYTFYSTMYIHRYILHLFHSFVFFILSIVLSVKEAMSPIQFNRWGLLEVDKESMQPMQCSVEVTLLGLPTLPWRV